MTYQNVLTIEVNLANIKTKRQYMVVMSKQFRFPAYFGFNIDGMNDCMRDLSWFDKNYLNIIFVNLDKIENNHLRDEIADNINTWQEYWHCIENYQDIDKIVLINCI